MKYFAGVLILTVAFLFAQTNVANGAAGVAFCYWGTWSHYRTGDGQFRVSDIDPNLCTHIGYSFFGISDSGEMKSLDSWLDFDLGNIAKTVALKKVNPSLKVMASVGGWNEGSSKYSTMASSSSGRSKFINSAVQFLQKNGFDGLDLDWEYPAQRGGSSADRANFVTLLKELNTALKAKNLLLTIAVGAGKSTADQAYDIPNLSKHVDLINLMTYDFSGSWERTAGFNSPLQGQGDANVKSAVSYWLQKGAPANKLVVGLPLYGRSFTLANSANNKPGAAVTGGGTPGPYTKESSYLGYNEICENLKNQWTRRWDSTYLVPYAFKDNQWVGYDDKQSFAEKAKYINSLKLAGGMFWSIETEDFRGKCGEKYPLLKALKSGLSGKSVATEQSQPEPESEPSQPEPEPEPSQPESPAPPQAPSSSNSGDCSQDGSFVNPSACNLFYQCNGGVRYDFSCPAGLNFDQANGVCNWPDAVNCNP